MNGLKEIIQPASQFQSSALHAYPHWNRSWLPESESQSIAFCSLLDKAFKDIELGENAGDLSGLPTLLAKLTISRLYDLQLSAIEARTEDISQADQTMRKYWRNEGVGKALKFNDVSIFDTWSVDHLRNWAKILLDRRQFSEAELLADILVQKQNTLLEADSVIEQSVFKDLMLWAYTTEGCAQNSRNDERLSKAISFLTNTVRYN